MSEAAGAVAILEGFGVMALGLLVVAPLYLGARSALRTLLRPEPVLRVAATVAAIAPILAGYLLFDHHFSVSVGVQAGTVSLLVVEVMFLPFGGSVGLLSLLLRALPQSAGRMVGRWIDDLSTAERRELERDAVGSKRLRRTPAIRRWLRRSPFPHTLFVLLTKDRDRADDVGPIFERMVAQDTAGAFEVLDRWMTPHQLQQVSADSLAPYLTSDDPTTRRTAFRALGHARAVPSAT